MKILFLIYRYIKTFFKQSTFSVRFIPTDKCNLNCAYCWQKKDTSEEMSKENFKKYLDHALKLNVAVVDFIGGEPMLWPHIFHALSKCSEKNIITNLTTNGTLLNKKTLNQLGQSGLDYLNISMDSLYKNNISSKNCLNNEKLVEILLKTKKQFKMKIRVNAVICKNNFQQTKELLDFLHDKKIPVSLGFVMSFSKKDQKLCYTKNDIKHLEEIVSYIIACQKKGYNIIDPASYFENIFKFLKKKKFWQCNYPTKFGWINVLPDGNIRSCTKKMDKLPINFLDLTPKEVKKLRNLYKEKIKECNPLCYSNCAYDSWYYVHHKFEFIKRLIF